MSKYIKEVKIDSYDKLIRIIKGKTKHCNDLRENFIFRGVENSKFPLIPSALRKNKIENYVDEDFKVELEISCKHAIENGLHITDETPSEGCFEFFKLDKYGNPTEGKSLYAHSLEEYQYLKEVNALMKFFENGDKVGLKIPTSQDIRDLLSHGKKERNYNFNWPNKNYFELISLAQHYGVPTRALDWSYDYKVATYFAVKNILNDNYLCDEKPDAAVIWAFNYKPLEIDCLGLKKNPFAIKHYRPEYNSNPNLNAQKGMFTFIINDLNYITKVPFDEFIESLLIGNHNFEGFEGEKFIKLNNNEKAFYKFIIPEDKKPEILHELYLEGYSEEYLFPGYSGVTQSIENRIKLDKIRLNKINCNKKNVLLVMNQNEIQQIKDYKEKYIFKRNKFREEIDKIFIYSKETKKVIGSFKGNEIIFNTPKYFWKNFSNESGLTREEFGEYYDNKKYGYAIKINDLRIFKNPIKLYKFKEPGNYCYIENKDELKFLLNFW